MANKSLFASKRKSSAQKADTKNEAGGLAYSLSAKHELAQYVMTGCLNNTFYADAKSQLEKILELSAKVSPKFLSQLAIYARCEGYMKDTPTLLVAILSTRDTGLFKKTAWLVIDNAKMLRNFVQIMRSGVVGRKSLGSAPKKFVQEWLAKKSDKELFRANVGQNPSMADVIKMVHPTPNEPGRDALYAYLLKKDYDNQFLPEIVKDYENFKRAMFEIQKNKNHFFKRHIDIPRVPDVPFRMLTQLPLKTDQWKQIAINAGWHMTRMNLNTFQRHGVFDVFQSNKVSKIISQRLSNRELVKKAKAFPFQLMSAYLNAGSEIPKHIKEALQDAMEVAIENVPTLDMKVVVCPDVSGSMFSPVSGYRKGASSKVTCVQVAALIASVILRKNRNAEVIPFHDRVLKVNLNPRDSVMTNAMKLSNLGSGGTNCSLPLKHMNKVRMQSDLVIYVSDNESWIDTKSKNRYWNYSTEFLNEWLRFQKRNPKAKLVCLDIQPYGTVQAPESDEILNIGGFSDQVFKTIRMFAKNKLEPGYWVHQIEKSVA